MPLTQLYASTKDSVVQVLAISGNQVVSAGSGSIIHDGSVVLTCAHCIVAGAQMAIVDSSASNRGIFGSVLFTDAQNDVALLQLSQRVGSPVRFGQSQTCEPGNGAYVIGFPLNIMERTLLSAHIASASPERLRIDCSVNHGNSGGPLFNLRGEQVGVVNSKHGTLSQFLEQVRNAPIGGAISIGGVDPMQAIKVLIEEMQTNLNLGIGYAIPTAKIKGLHPLLTACVPQ